MKTTYTLEKAEIAQAVAEYLARKLDKPVEQIKVDLKITDAQPFYNPLDAGAPASVKAVAEIGDQ